MIYTGEREFEYPDAKPVFSAWYALIDISEFLASLGGGDTIDSVVFTAVKNTPSNSASLLRRALLQISKSGTVLLPRLLLFGFSMMSLYTQRRH